MRTILRRAAAHPAGWPKTTLTTVLWFKLVVLFEGAHPLEGGAFRLKFQHDRRHGMPLENRVRTDRRRPGAGGQRTAVVGHRTFEEVRPEIGAQQEQQRVRNARASERAQALARRDEDGPDTRPRPLR
jgi:hypothetical protein